MKEIGHVGLLASRELSSDAVPDLRSDRTESLTLCRTSRSRIRKTIGEKRVDRRQVTL